LFFLFVFSFGRTVFLRQCVVWGTNCCFLTLALQIEWKDRREMMRRTLMAAAAIVALAATPNLASADPNDAAGGAAAGVAIGAGTGLLVGGPIGAVIGAGIGGTVGAGAGASVPPRQEVIVEQPARSVVRERSCMRDSAGNVVCQEIRR
jgi:hypothetical protein